MLLSLHKQHRYTSWCCVSSNSNHIGVQTSEEATQNSRSLLRRGAKTKSTAAMVHTAWFCRVFEPLGTPGPKLLLMKFGKRQRYCLAILEQEANDNLQMTYKWLAGLYATTQHTDYFQGTSESEVNAENLSAVAHTKPVNGAFLFLGEGLLKKTQQRPRDVKTPKRNRKATKQKKNILLDMRNERFQQMEFLSDSFRNGERMRHTDTCSTARYSY